MPSWTLRAAVVCFAAVLVASPTASAQDVFTTTQIQVRSLDGVVLISPGVDTLVELVATVRYDGNDSVAADPVQVQLRITPPTGATLETSHSVVPNRTQNSTIEVVFTWRPTTLGSHKVEITVGNQISSRTIIVSEAAREAGTVVDRLVEHWYVVAGFVSSIVLFSMVASVRRTP